MVGRPGFFDLSPQYEQLSAAGDPLEPCGGVDFKVLCGPLVASLHRSPLGG